MAFECSSTTVLPVFIGLWTVLFELVFPYVALPREYTRKWLYEHPRHQSVPWIYLSTLVSAIFKVAGTAMACYSACENDKDTHLVNVFFAFLIAIEYVTLALWVRPSALYKQSPALAGVSAHLVVGLLFTANQFQYGEFAQGSLILVSVLCKIPQFYMYSRMGGPVRV